MRRLAVAFVLAAGLGASSWAQPVVRREGEYTGVTPGQTPADHKRRAKKGTLSWIGFQPKDGGAEVFFQSSDKFELDQRVERGVLIVSLPGLVRGVRNARRPIDTRFFDNPLARITTKPARRVKGRARGLEVHIAFKNPKDARQGTVRTATEPDGLFYAYLTFPEGAESAEGKEPNEGKEPEGDDSP